MMKKKNSKSGTLTGEVRTRILSAIIGKTDVVEAVKTTVAEAIAGAAGKQGNTSAEVANLITQASIGAIKGAIETGCDLALASRGLIEGVLNGTRLAGSEVTDTITRASSIAIKATAETGGDLGATATGLLHGAIEGAKELGIDTQDCASAAALGALNAVGDVRSTGYERVLKAVTLPIEGITVAPATPQISLN